MQSYKKYCCEGENSCVVLASAGVFFVLVPLGAAMRPLYCGAEAESRYAKEQRITRILRISGFATARAAQEN